jgi:ankyrin repeat protein
MFPNTRQNSFNSTAPAWDAIFRDDAESLAAADFDPKATRGGEQTMLHYACEHDAHQCAAWLCRQKGMDVNVQDAQLRTPFLIACENRALRTLGVLLARKDVDLTAVTKQEQGALHLLCSSDDALSDAP